MQKTMPSASKHIGLFGGTFCPIHHGHLQAALFLQQQLAFDEFIFLPNKAPVMDKTASALPAHRLAMLAQALAPYLDFKVDRREIDRSTPSFMIETLVDLREVWGEMAAISLIIGSDSFQQFHRWHKWQKILTLCNLIVIDRRGHERVKLSPPLSEAIDRGELHEIADPKVLSTTSRGGFYRCDARTDDISSTQIRHLIQTGGDASPYLPVAVLNYIKEKKLFR